MLNSKIYLGAAVAISVIIADISSVQAEGECDAPLRNGVFDQLQLRNNSYSRMVLAWQFSQMTAEEARRHVEGNATIPIEGVPLTGGFTDDQFNSWKQSVRQALQTERTQWNDLSISQLTASPTILNTWLGCMQSRSGLIGQVDTNDDQHMVFKVKFVPSGSVTRAKVTTPLNITNASALYPNELETLQANRFVDAATKVVQIRRTSIGQPITITLGTNEGSVSRYIPAIVTVPPMPPPVPWALVRGECVNVQNPNWQVMVSNAQQETQVVLTGWWFNHVPTGILPGTNIPIEIRNASGQVLRSFANDQEPFIIKAGESAYLRIGDIEYVDNDLPWAGNTRPGQPPLRFLIKRRIASPGAPTIMNSALCGVEP